VAEPQKDTAAKEKTPNAVQYTGSADIREITQAQWAKAGVDDQDKVVRWSAENDFTVAHSDLSKKAIALLEKDSDMKPVVVEA
jgi:cell fate (sporulation/competence/biofilm development) regulator YlbF (YheA/YmcA/DUF963 family)